MTGTSVASATYFGKVPSRGDFIKGSGQAQLVGMLDRWLSQSMELLATDPRWKTTYDNATPLHFAFVGARSRLSIVGHLHPSHDASNRRFPFLAATAIDRDDDALFHSGPVYFSRLWHHFRRIVEQTCASDDPAAVLIALGDIDCNDEVSATGRSDALNAFLRAHTLARFEAMLETDTRQVDMRRILLALGLLLRPLLGTGTGAIEKGLSLPLAADPLHRDLSAALWMSLVARFLMRSAAELQMLVVANGAQPRLILGFNGASAKTLLSGLAPDTSAQTNIVLDDPEWVDTHPALTQDYGVAKLSSYLTRADISLPTAIATFKEVFLGE